MRARGGVAFVIALLFVALSASAEQTTYDSLGRVISVITDDGKQTNYVYDAAGNRTTAATAATTSTKPPIAVNDVASFAYGSTMAPINVLANDSDPNGLALTVIGVAPAQFGTVSFTSTQVTYTPSTYIVAGSDIFAYTIKNSAGVTASALVTVNLTVPPPIANPDSVSVVQNGSATFDPRANDTDPSGLALVINALGAPSHGAAVINNGGTSVTYTPSSGYYGSDSFGYTIANSRGLTASSTVSATVAPGPPIANPYNLVTNQNQVQTFDPRTIDSDPNGLALTISSVGTPSHGAAVVNGGTSITYTPTSGYTGSDLFSYSIVNSAGRGASSTVNVSIQAATALSAAVNVSTWNWYRTKSGVTTIDPAVQTTPSGGTPGYTYVWQYVSGDTSISPTTSTASTTQWTWTPVYGATRTAIWRCQVSDSASHVAYTSNVTVTVEWDNGQ